MLCNWRVKAGMVRVWVADKTVYTLLAISKRFRDRVLYLTFYCVKYIN